MSVKATTEMSFEELVDWAAGYILTALIAGRFRTSVWLVCNQATRWKEEQKKKSNKEKT